MMLADLLSLVLQNQRRLRTILEAQAMGRPVLAFNHGGSVELINENKNGILSPVLDMIYFENILKSYLFYEG